MRSNPLPTLHTRVCVICNKQFAKRLKEGQKTFEQRRYCNQLCYYEIRRREKVGHGRPVEKDPLKFCRACDLQLVRKSGEVPSKFDQRNYCGLDCRQKAVMTYGIHKTTTIQ